MHKEYNSNTTFCIILIFIAFLAIGWIWYFENTVNSNIQELFNEENFVKISYHNFSATFTESIDTFDWFTYRNEEYGFEFQYPKEWEISDYNITELSLYGGEDFDFIINNMYFYPKNTYTTISEVYKKRFNDSTILMNSKPEIITQLDKEIYFFNDISLGGYEDASLYIIDHKQLEYLAMIYLVPVSSKAKIRTKTIAMSFTKTEQQNKKEKCFSLLQQGNDLKIVSADGNIVYQNLIKEMNYIDQKIDLTLNNIYKCQIFIFYSHVMDTDGPEGIWHVDAKNQEIQKLNAFGQYYSYPIIWAPSRRLFAKPHNDPDLKNDTITIYDIEKNKVVDMIIIEGDKTINFSYPQAGRVAVYRLNWSTNQKLRYLLRMKDDNTQTMEKNYFLQLLD